MPTSFTEHPWVRFPIRVARSFDDHRGLVRAASLSYTSLLALVPLIALVLSVSKAVLATQDPGFLYEKIDQFLAYAVPQIHLLSQQQTDAAREDVFARVQEAIDRVNAGALGAFGALTLATVGITLLSAVEAALNDVWGVAKGRGIAQRVVYYWTGVTLGSIVLFFSLGLTGSTVVVKILGVFPGPLTSFAFQFVAPFVVLATGFTLLYWVMPNTRVPIRAAMWGGLAAGALFQANNLVSAFYVSQVVVYSRVYGSLAAIPVVMVGLYFAWVIVLIGAEVARAAAQPAVETTEHYPESPLERSRLALEVARLAAAAFLDGGKGATATAIATRLAVPLDWVNRTTTLLETAGIMVEVDGGDEGSRFLPARPPHSITAFEVIEATRRTSDAERGAGRDRSAVVDELLSRIEAAEREAAAPVSLADLAGRVERK